MIQAVADTHALIWYLFGDRRIGPLAHSTIHDAETHGNHIAISSITLIEIVFLSERGKIDSATFARTLAETHRADAWLVEVPLDEQIARAMQAINRHATPEMPDRVIAATALHLGVPVISRDPAIHASGLTVIW